MGHKSAKPLISLRKVMMDKPLSTDISGPSGLSMPKHRDIPVGQLPGGGGLDGAKVVHRALSPTHPPLASTPPSLSDSRLRASLASPQPLQPFIMPEAPCQPPPRIQSLVERLASYRHLDGPSMIIFAYLAPIAIIYGIALVWAYMGWV